MKSANLWKIRRLQSGADVLRTIKEMTFLLFILVKRRARFDGWMSHPEKKLCWCGPVWKFACSTEKLDGCCSLTRCPLSFNSTSVIDVIYESDGSSDQEKALNDEKERVAVDGPKDGEGDQGVIPGQLNGLEKEKEDYLFHGPNVIPDFDVGLAAGNVEAFASDTNEVPASDKVEVNPVITETELAPPPTDDALVGGHFVPSLALVMPQPITPE